MPVEIGAVTPNCPDPTRLLLACHRRIETSLRTLAAVAAVTDQPATWQTTRLLKSALSYFSHAVSLHTADEEDSLFPRLREARSLQTESVISELERLEHEHDIAILLHAETDQLGTQYLFTGTLSEREVERFRETVANLARLYHHHILVEEELLFPLAIETLSPVDKAAIAKEMAARRSIDSGIIISEPRRPN